MKPYTITVVIEAPTEMIRLRQELLGGKIIRLGSGDKIEVAEKYEPTVMMNHGKPVRAWLAGSIPPIPGRADPALPESAQSPAEPRPDEGTRTDRDPRVGTA